MRFPIKVKFIENTNKILEYCLKLMAELKYKSKSCDRTRLATVNALNATSLVIRWLCVSIKVAIFSASRTQASRCNGVKFGPPTVWTITNISDSIVRYPLSLQCAT